MKPAIYFKTAVLAVLALQILPISAQVLGTGLRGEYFANSTLSGQPVLTRTDATLAFEWQASSPASVIPVDEFSVRWTGELVAEFSETYTLVLPSDDGVRVWIDNTLVINEWVRGANGTRTVNVPLTANRRTPIRIDYFEGNGGAAISLLWYSNSVGWSVVPSQRLFPATTSPQATPAELAAMQASQKSIRFVPQASGIGEDVVFERAWALGTSHRCVVERSENLQNWLEVNHLTTLAPQAATAGSDTLRMPSDRNQGDEKTKEPICRAFYRVRYLPIN